MPLDDVLALSAVEQSALVAARKITSEELTVAYLERIEARNERTHAFVHVLADAAVRQAKGLDRARGERRSALHGVPIAVKDLNSVRGSFTRFGSRAFARYFSPFDDLTVATMRRAGLVFVGKSTTSEFGTMPVTEPDTHPPTRNPFDTSVTAGGSSGGAAAAVADGMVPIAHGSDAGGSIRIPSSFCGLVGMKATRGLVPNSYGIEDPDIIYTSGPVARNAKDAAALLDVLAGTSFLARVDEAPRPLRVRMVMEHPMIRPTPEIDLAIRRFAGMLEDHGHRVEEAPGPTGNLDEFLPIWQWNTAQIPILDWSEVEPVTRWLGEIGRTLPTAMVRERVRELGQRFLALSEGVDLVLTPTVAVPPSRIGAYRELEPEEAFRRVADMGAFTALFNLTGQPAITIPAGVSRAGHPIGAQLVAHHGKDELLLRLARSLEQR